MNNNNLNTKMDTKTATGGSYNNRFVSMATPKRTTLPIMLLLAASQALVAPPHQSVVMAFSTTTSATSTTIQKRSAASVMELQLSSSSSSNNNNNNMDDDISRQMERARQLLAKSKAKMEAMEQQEVERAAMNGSNDVNGNSNGESNNNVPFFAMKDNKNNGKKKDKVIKSTNEEGLITTDGEKMAELSELEEWEDRSLLEVFRNERGVKENPLADRDVALSIFQLQRSMRNDDYKKIFDKRNRFIGEQ